MRTSSAVALVNPLPRRTSEPTLSRNHVATELFDAHAEHVYRLAVMILGQADAAEDVLQDTFIRLLAHIDAQRPLTNARGWLLTVAAHACRDRQRAARRWVPWLAERDTRVAPDRSDHADAAGPLLDALKQLNRRDRLLVSLRAQGLSYQEIATATGVRHTSIGNLLARAIGRLTTHLDRHAGTHQ